MSDVSENHEPTAEFSAFLARDIARTFRHEARFAPSERAVRARRIGVIVASGVGAVIALAIGLVWGANTGYASARVEGERRHEARVSAITAVTSQLGALRADLRHAHAEFMQLGLDTVAAPRTSLLAAEAELRAMDASAARIERDLSSGEDAAALSSSALGSGSRVQRAIASTCSALSLAAQPAPGPQGVPMIDLPPASAKSASILFEVLGVRQVADGRVFVAEFDPRNQGKLRLFDAALSSWTDVRDSVGPMPLIVFRGDSSLSPDIQSRSLLVIDASGSVARSWKLPDDPQMMWKLATGSSAADDKGRLLYLDGKLEQLRAGPRDTVSHDTMVVAHADLDSRRIDTVGRVVQALDRTPGRARTVVNGDGTTSLRKLTDPLPVRDDWAVLSDGTIAFVRGRDYHVDWIHPDGTKSSTAKLPFDWKRLTDQDKQKLIDSVRGAHSARPFPATDYVPLNELPDYYPVLRDVPRRVIADRDGNLWIMTSAQPGNGERVYDVVNPRDGLFERVRTPAGRTVVGFGKGGVVYLLADRIAGRYASGSSLERTQLPAIKARHAP